MRSPTGWKLSAKKYKEHFHWDIHEVTEPNNLTEETLEPFMVHPRRRILAHLKQLGVQPNERIPYNSAPPPTINQQYIISSAPPDPGEFNANEYQDFVFPIHHPDDSDRISRVLWNPAWDEEDKAAHEAFFHEWEMV